MAINPQDPIELLILDHDGVVVESEKIHIPIWRDLANECSWPITLEEAVKRFKSHTNHQIQEMIEKQVGHKIDTDLTAELNRRARIRYPDELEEIEGIREVLDSPPCQYCVVSNSTTDELVAKLTPTDLIRYFDNEQLISAADLGIPKAEAFALAAKRFDVAVSRCLVVEDSPPGVMAALETGMEAAGYAGASFTDEAELAKCGVRVFTSMTELGNYLSARQAVDLGNTLNFETNQTG